MSKSAWLAGLEESTSGRRILEQERLIVEVTETIAGLMADQNLSRSELATRIGKSRSFVTKLLGGTNNFTLRTLGDVFMALGRSAHLTVGELGEQVQLCSVQETTPLSIDASKWAKKQKSWVSPTLGSELSVDTEDLAA
jgi:transcriptional regulator with XRE-family HTH domain